MALHSKVHKTVPKMSVILTTYKAEEWLEKVILGYKAQLFQDIELIIADDGSGPATRKLIEYYQPLLPFPLRHIWQEDDGFQKTKILNKALVETKADYIVISDGDCIPREDFLQIHYDARRPQTFLSGGYYKLPMSTSKKINADDIATQNCFRLGWLLKHGVPHSIKNLKFISRGLGARILNTITPTRPSWNGHNASGWKKDILAINGFDERMKWGGLDREMGERLEYYGCKGKQIRYSAICIHLDHKRGYITADQLEENRKIRRASQAKKAPRTPYGIVTETTD